MTTLADDIKRLRELDDDCTLFTIDREEMLQTINTLVELLANVYENLSHLPTNILNDVAEIAALAKGE